MKDTKKAVLIVLGVAAVSLVLGAVAFSAGLGEVLPKEGLMAALLGRTPMHFGMKCCLISVIATIGLVPSIRAQFLGSYTTGSDYKDSRKMGRGGRI